ncbi:MAG: hypothetical protein II969_08455 [Anaerolineaceae bacterium]|nr:hypothetical protein [Anaerolineaceae bacterium]
MRRLLKNLSFLLSAAILLLSLQTVWADELNVYVDRSDPIIVVSNTRLDGNKLTVTGTAFDEYSGIQTVEASAEGKPFETVGVYPTGAGGEWIWIYTVPEDCGQYGHFVFRAVDNAGNTAEITRNDIEIYNKKAALIFPDYVIKNIAVTPEVVGEPVRAVVNVSGHGYDYEEWELTDPSFTLVWDGFISGIEVPAGNYLLTIRTYNQTGQFTVSNMQAIVPSDGEEKPGEERYHDVPISGTVEDIDDEDAVVSGQDLVITDDSQIDDDIKPGDKVIGLGRYDTVTGEIEIRILKKTDEPARSLPDIEVEGDEKTGEIEFAGIIEAVGPDYIIVDGEVIFVTENTEINCDFSELRPGDYVSGLAEIFSKSGTKALIVNKADTEKADVETIVGHVTAMGDGWVEIDTGNGRYIITDSTIVDGNYEIGTLIMLEVLVPDNEVLKLKVLKHAECSDGLSYYYGDINGIFKDTGELVIGELIHNFDGSLTTDEIAGLFENDAIAAAVDYECRTVALRVVQNAGDPREQDRIAGNVTSVGKSDVNGNTPVYIDGKYHFISRNSDKGSELKPDMVVAAVQTGEELISISEIPEASISADDLTDFAGTVARVSGEDSYGRRYILVNGITYRLLPDTVISETVGKLEKGAVVAGTVLGNDIVHAAVIKAKAEDVNPDNAFVGTVTAEVSRGRSGYAVMIDGQRYTADESSLVYFDLEPESQVLAVHDGGTLLAIRDYPENAVKDVPVSFIASIENVSAKDYTGSFTVTADGYTYRIDEDVFYSGYIAAGMKCLITCIEHEDGERELVSLVAGNYPETMDNIRTVFGKVGAISLPGDNGNRILLIDGFSYQYTQESVIQNLNEGDFVIAAIRDGIILSAAVREETVYGKPESFSGVIEAVSDMQTDGSYIVTVDGTEIALTKDTLLNDAEADIEPDTVLSGIRFGNTAWAAATYGIGLMETSDAAFSGVIEKVDLQNHTLTVRGRFRNAAGIDLSGFTPGMIAAGALQPGKGMISVQAISPELDLDDIESFSGTVESISATDIDGTRKLSLKGDVYFITGTTYVSGDVKDGSRIAGFMNVRTSNVIVLTVAEAEDLGGYMEGKIEEITSEQIQVPEKSDWYHLLLGGMYNLVGDKTVLISEELKAGDKVSGYYFGPERKLLAVLEEDTSLLGRIRNASLPVKIGMGVLGAGFLGSGAALAIGGKKKRFAGILELESDTTILVKDLSDPEKEKCYKLPKNLYETACLLNHKRVSGFTRFGKIEKLDIDE